MKLTNKLLVIYCGIAFLQMSGIAYAGSATVPHNFVAGTAAKASDVNDNFAGLKSSIDDNDTRISNNNSSISTLASDVVQAAKRYVIVDANDNIISGAFGGTPQGPLVMSSQGYVGKVDVTTGLMGMIINVYYPGTNCTGSAYMDFSNTLQEEDYRVIGGVYNAVDWYNGVYTNPIEYWYVPKTPTIIDNLQVQSVRAYDDNTQTVVCNPLTATISTAVETFANDPAITGFLNVPFATPLRYDYR
jgi:hypothetical protein